MKKCLQTFLLLLFGLVINSLFAQVQTDLDKGLRFIEQNAISWGLEPGDIKDMMVNDMYTNNKTGITYIYFNQGYKGIPIQNAITPVVISKEGKVFNVDNAFVKNIESKISSSKPNILPEAAIKSSVNHLGLKANGMPSLKRSLPEKNIYEYGKADFAENEITVKLVYIIHNSQLSLAWNLAIDELDDEDYYNTFVDANTGEVITKYNYTVKCQIHKDKYSKHIGCNSDHNHKVPAASSQEATTLINAASGTYNVFALPTESPLHGQRSLQVDPFFTDASPYGWHDTNGVDGAEETITRGNNVHAYLDKENTGFSLGDEPEGGNELVFDLPYDINNEANVNENASVVNLFYMANMMHDITKRLGFDEQAGNFQLNNYGNGALGNDYVLAQASDGILLATPTLNNANFATPPDGGNGQMQMFLWENPSGILSIDEPAELAGFINPVGTATTATVPFGGPIPDQFSAAITGSAAIAFDNSPSSPTTCCNPIINPDDIAGKIAIIDRGLCDFSLKAYHAQQAGAISVIICNVLGTAGDGEIVVNMNGGEQASNVTIVPLFLKKSDCDRIKASLLADIDVKLTIQNRPPMGPTYLDGAVDNGVIAHEYGHGISNRLIGGRLNASCLTTDEQMGEGISDYFSLVTTVEEGDKGTDPRGIGNYADGQNINGRGIRTYPYSTDLNINSLVYDDVKITTNQYDLGEIYTVAMWEVYWAFVDKYGLDTKWEDENSGNYKAVRLTIEGMKLVPCDPSLIDMRDGVLKADSILYGAENTALLWEAFAKRGFGYLATDGEGSNDRTDGVSSYEPLPLSIEKLKVRKEVATLVNPGADVEVRLTVQNHIPAKQTNVTVTDNVPAGMTYVPGSSSIAAEVVDNELIFNIGDMEYKDELVITYLVNASSGISSQSLFYDNVDDAEENLYEFGATEDYNLWQKSFDLSYSGFSSWWASQPDTELETDFYMDIPKLQVVGSKPALKFQHRYDTEIGIDGGFITISDDGGQIFRDVKNNWLRNGYPFEIDYSTFAIPSLEGFTGSSNGEWVDSYLDLSDYIGKEIIVKFRFGTNNTGGVVAENPGWFVDDLEMLDLVSYETFACVSSTESQDQCSVPVKIIIGSEPGNAVEDENEDIFEIGIAPNPARDYFTVNLKSDVNTPAILSLVTMDGRTVSTQSLVIKDSGVTRSFDTSSLQSGMYLLQIRSQTGLSTRKVIIQ